MRMLGVPVWLLLLATGCAFGNRSVVLSYPPGPPKSADGEYKFTAVTPKPTPVPEPLGRVVLVTFLDQRPSKQAVGAVHNGYGMHTADAIATNSVPGWVMKGIAVELARQGFQVEEVPDVPRGSAIPIISGDVVEVVCQMYTRYESTVEFSVVVSSAGKIALQKNYKGVDESTTNWTAGSDSIAQSLATALQTAAENFAVEFRRLALMSQSLAQ